MLELGNLGGRGVLAVWEIQSGGGAKMLAIHQEGGVYFFWNNPIVKWTYASSLRLQLNVGVLKNKLQVGP